MLIEFTHKHNQLLLPWKFIVIWWLQSIKSNWPTGQTKPITVCTLVHNFNTFEKTWIATNVISNKESVRSRQSTGISR